MPMTTDFHDLVFTPSVSARQMAELMADGTRPTLATLTQLAANGTYTSTPCMICFDILDRVPVEARPITVDA